MAGSVFDVVTAGDLNRRDHEYFSDRVIPVRAGSNAVVRRIKG